MHSVSPGALAPEADSTVSQAPVPADVGRAAGNGVRVHGTPRRRFALACAAGSALATVVFVWMVSDRSWTLLQRGFATNFYDSQARSLLAGHWYMPASVLGVEAFRTGSHTYMYFGPVPALLRMPVLLLTHHFDGRLSGISMLVAQLVLLIFTGCLLWRIRGLLRPSSSGVSVLEAVLAGSCLFMVGCGSTVLYLAAWPSVYNEAELWATALAVGSLYFMTAFNERPTRRWLGWTGVFVFLTVFTRVTIGLGLILALVILAFVEWRRTGTDPATRVRRSGALLAVAALPLALYAYMNEVKFHTLIGVPFVRQAANRIYPAYRLAVHKNGGTLFAAHYAPTNLLNYLRPDALYFTSWFPWITFRPAKVLGGTLYAGIESPTSALTTMPVLVLLAVIGIVAAFRKRKPCASDAVATPPAGLRAVRIPLVGALVASASIFVYGFLATRYLADLLPFLVLAGSIGIAVIAAAAPRMAAWRRRLLLGGLLLLSLFGLWTQVALSLLFQGATGPFITTAERVRFVSLRDQIDGAVLGNHAAGVKRVGQVPRAPGPAGQVAVLGNCSALYQSFGAAWGRLETGEASGHFVLEVVAPPERLHASLPILASTQADKADVLTLHALGHDMVNLTYWYEGTQPILDEGAPFRMTPGRTYVINAEMDAATSLITASVNGAQVFATYAPVHAGRFMVGTNPFGEPVAPSFPGSLRRLDPTPICSGLLHSIDRALH